MTKEERYNTYMKLEKEELAKMLVERDIIEAITPTYINFPLDRRSSLCKTWKDCTNPCKDCIDCPLRYKSGDRVFTTSEYKPFPETPSEGIWY